MCTVSMIGDHYRDKWGGGGIGQGFPFGQYATQQDLDALRREVLEMKELLKRAVEYDKTNNQPHCENEQKLAVLRAVAKSLGVSLDDVLGPAK